MIIKLIHNDDKVLANKFKEFADYLKITYEIYNMRYTSDKKKGFKVKGSFSARMDPFIAIYDKDGRPIKGLYSEAGECTIDNLEKYISDRLSKKIIDI